MWQYLAGRIGEIQGGDPWRSVQVVVPSNVAGLQARRHVARTSGKLFNVQFLDPARLAEQIVAEFGAERKPLASQAVAIAAAWSVLQTADPSLSRFGEAARLPNQLVQAFEAMEKAESSQLTGVRPAMREAYEQYRLLLAGYSSRTEVHADAARLIMDVVPHDRWPFTLGFGLESLGADGDVVACALKERIEFCTYFANGQPAIEVCEVHDPIDEVRVMIAKMQDLVLSGKAHPYEIGVIVPSNDPYGKLIDLETERAGLTWNGGPTNRLADRRIGQLVRGISPDLTTWSTVVESYKGALSSALDVEQPAAQRISDSLTTWLEISSIVEKPSRILVEALIDQALNRPDQIVHPFGEGFYAGSLPHMAGLHFKHVFVLGFTASAFPKSAKPLPLLPRSFQRSSSVGHWQAFQPFLKSPGLTITLPRLDRRNDREAFPSPWLDKLPEHIWTTFDSPTHILKTFGYRMEPPITLTEATLDEPVLHLDLTPKKETSPSAIETFIACPRSWFYRYQIGLREPDRDPELGPMPDKRGRALHTAFANLFNLRQAELNNPQYQWSPTDREQVAEDYRQELRRSDLDPDHPAVRRETERCIERIQLMLDHDQAYRSEQGAVPICIERELTGEFEGLRLKGITDRIDRLTDGSISVIDYKSGQNSKDTKADCLKKGGRLQGVLYALMAQSELGEVPGSIQYWYFDEHSKNNIRCDAVSPTLIEETLKYVRLMAQMLQIGAVPMWPMPHHQLSVCPYCPYKTICPATREALVRLPQHQYALFTALKRPPGQDKAYQPAAQTGPSTENLKPTGVNQDEDARQAAVRHGNKSMMLEAGAGSGKTKTMVDRLAAAVGTHHKLERIVAITFTVKAAHELATRLRKQLDPEQREELVKARIGTIDSILQGILNEYALEAGIPGGAQVLSETDFETRRDAWFKKAFSRWASDSDLTTAWQELDRLGLSQGKQMRKLKDVVKECARRRVSTEPMEPFNFEGIDDRLSAILTRAEAEIRLIDPTNKLIEQLESARENLAGFRSDPLYSLTKPDKRVGGAKGKPCMEAVEELYSQAADLQAAYCYSLVRPLIERVILDFKAWIGELKIQGHVTFDSALDSVNHLLTNHPEAKSELQEQIDALLIDEFQDTSPAQMEFVSLVTGGSNIPLFVVGDPKQSIYRFRGADLASYNRFRDSLTGGEAQLAALTANFRSQPAIARFVNTTLGPAMTDLTFHDMEAHGKACGRIRSYVGAIGSEVKPADRAREAQSDMVVAAIRAAKSEKWEVGEDARPIRYSDMAILCTTRRLVEDLSQRLQTEGIPTQVESAIVIGETEATQAILNVLRTITWPDRGAEDREGYIAQIAALRSIAFGVSDLDLRTPDYTPLKALKAAAKTFTPAQLIRAIIDQTRLKSVEATSPDEVRYLMDKALALESEGVASLADFVNKLTLLAQEDGKFNPIGFADQDAVRVMTIHASKGLEFPLVIVAGIKDFKADSLGIDEHNRIHFKIKGENDQSIYPLGYHAWQERDKSEKLKESIRLLYVAATRARDHLIISAYHSGGDEEAKLREAMAEKFPLGFAAHPAEAAESDPVVILETEAVRRAWREVVQSEPRTTPSILAHAVNDEEEPEEQTNYRAASRQGTAIGKALHLAMQTLNLMNPNVDEVAEKAAQFEGLNPAEVAPLAHNCLASPAFRPVLQAHHVLREVYAAIEVDGLLIEGMVDLVYEKPDGTLGVIDYKTDSVFNLDRAEERMAGGYRKQGEAYRQMLTLATGKDVSSVDFIFVRPNPALVISL